MPAAAVQAAIYQLSYDTGDSVSKLNATRTAADNLVKSTDQVAVSEEKVTKATRTSADAMDKLLAKLDPRIRAEQQLQKTMDQVNRIQKEGIGTINQHAAAIALAEQKYQKIIGANDNFTKGLASFKQGLSSINGILGAFGVTLGAIALVQFGKRVFDTTADLQEQADQVLGAGGNVEAFQALHGVFLTNGISMEAGDKIVGKLTRSLGEAAEGSKTAQDAFHKLGLGSKELAGNTADAALPLVAAKLLAIQDASKRAAIETALFGKSGQQLESALSALATPMDQLIQRAKDVGIVIDADMIKKADDAKDKMAISMMKLSVAIAPIITSWVDGFSHFATSIGDTTTAIDGLVRKIGALAGAYAGAKVGGLFGPLGAVAGAALGGVGVLAYQGPDAARTASNIAQYQARLSAGGMSPSERAELQGRLARAIAAANDNAPNLGLVDTGKETTTNYLAHAKAATPPKVTPWAPTAEDLANAQKIRVTYEGYLAEVTEGARLAGESAAQRTSELSVIKAAQIAEKDDIEQKKIKGRELSQTYEDAVKYLGQERALAIQIQEAWKRTNELGLQQDQQIKSINVGLAVDADHRALALKNLQDEITAGVEIGDQYADQRKQIEDKNAAIQAGQDATGYRDYIDSLKEEVSLTGLAADERERQQAVLQEMHATHGTLTADQAKEVDGIIKARQETEKWRGLVDSIQGAFQGFFEQVFETGTLSFGKLFRSIWAQFAAMLAQMAAQAIAQPIIIPMIGDMLGTLGLGGSGSGISGGSSSILGSLGNVGSLGSLLGGGSSGGLLSGLGSSISSGINSLGGFLGFATTPTISSAAGLSGALGGISGTSIPSGVGSIFGTSLGGFLGGAGLGSLASSLIFGNKNDAGIGGMGGSAAGALIGSIIPGVGTIIGGLLGGLLGGGLGSLTGSSNKSSTAALSNNSEAFNLVQFGDQGTQSKTTQAATAITTLIKQLHDAGVQTNSNIIGVNIGNDKSYIYTQGGGKEKLGTANDVGALVTQALNEILKSAHSNDANLQSVISHYMSNGGITANNIDQVVSDLGFAKTLANFDFGVTKLTQTEQTLKSITDQYDAAIQKAQTLGLDITALQNAEQVAIQSVTDNFNDSITDAINGILNGPLQAWNALIAQQSSQMDEAKAASADLSQVEKLQYLQRKQLLMSLNDAQRTALEGLVGLADDLAVKMTNLQAVSLEAVTSQIQAAQAFAQQQAQLSSQYGQASSSLDQARIGFLVDPNTSRASPMDAYTQSRGQLDQISGAAQGGDLNALNALGGAASTFLQNSLSVNASSAAYQADFKYVQDMLTSAKAAADKQQAATLTQAQLAAEQAADLSNILVELQKPDPNTDYLSKMLDQLTAINGGMTENTSAVLAQVEAAPTIAALDSLGGKLQGATADQQTAITGALDGLHTALADGLVTVAEAPAVTAALDGLQGILTDQLAHQSDLTANQLQSTLQAQALLDQIKGSIGAGVNITNLAAISGPLSQLIALGVGTVNQLGVITTTIATGGGGGDMPDVTAATAANTDIANTIGDSTGPYGDSFYSGRLDEWLHWDPVAKQYYGPTGDLFTGFAGGTDFAPGGWAMVGEQGPELMRLPRGAAIMPNSQVRSLAGNDNSALVAELKALRAQVGYLTGIMSNIEETSGRTADATESTDGSVKTVGKKLTDVNARLAQG